MKAPTDDPRMGTVPAMENASILVVEDATVIQRFVNETLTRAGAEVTVVENGLIALQVIRAHTPDLIVLDLAMPVMDGWSLLKAIRSNVAFSEVPVLIITAHGQTPTASGVDHLGADAFMGKPFSPTELLRVAGSLLTNGRKPEDVARDVAGASLEKDA